MWRLNDLLDDDFEEICRTIAKGFGFRLIFAIISATLISLTVGGLFAGGWFLAFIFAEAWVAATLQPIKSNCRGTSLQRLHLGLAGATAGCVWVANSVIYWLAGPRVLQFVAVVNLASILLSAQTQCARSLPMLLIVTVPPVLTLIIISLFFGDYHGFGLLMASVSLLMLVVQLVSGVVIHRQESTTLERLRREAVAANEAKSSFLATMSHEIRTPMNGVLGMAHALAKSTLNDAQQLQIGMLTRSGDSLMAILNDILDLSKSKPADYF